MHLNKIIEILICYWQWWTIFRHLLAMTHFYQDSTHFSNIKATFFVEGKMSKFGLLFLLVWSFVLFYSEIGRILHFASLWHALRRAWNQSQIYTFFTAVSHCFQDSVRSLRYVKDYFFFLNQTSRDRSEKDLASFKSNIPLLLWQSKNLLVWFFGVQVNILEWCAKMILSYTFYWQGLPKEGNCTCLGMKY